MPREKRQEIFAFLVAVQDQAIMTVRQSRSRVCAQCGISLPELLAIEDEGIEAEWPPLGQE